MAREKLEVFGREKELVELRRTIERITRMRYRVAGAIKIDGQLEVINGLLFTYEAMDAIEDAVLGLVLTERAKK